jgi:hypothetical protein
MQGRHIVSWALASILLFDIIAPSETERASSNSDCAKAYQSSPRGAHPVLLQAKLNALQQVCFGAENQCSVKSLLHEASTCSVRVNRDVSCILGTANFQPPTLLVP